MRPHRGQRRRSGFVHTVLHHGREFGRHADAFVRHFGPLFKMGAMAAAPAFANAGLPQAAAAATTAVIAARWSGAARRDCVVAKHRDGAALLDDLVLLVRVRRTAAL